MWGVSFSAHVRARCDKPKRKQACALHTLDVFVLFGGRDALPRVRRMYRRDTRKTTGRGGTRPSPREPTRGSPTLIGTMVISTTVNSPRRSAARLLFLMSIGMIHDGS
jgi:hypothetical protein